MATADTINSIRTHLTEDYEGLENLGVTAEDRNIENIRTCLDELYNNIPKTTDTGTNLSLNTIKGKMNIIPKGDTSQYSTNGYQLLEIPTNQSITSNGVTFSFDDKGILTINGKNTASNLYLTLSNSTPVASTSVNDMYTYAKSISNGQYKISTIYFSGTKTSGTMTCNVRKYGESAIVGVNVASETTRTNFEISTTGNYVTYIYIGQNVEFTKFKMGFMISSGTTNRDYEKYTGGIASPNPTYPQNIEVVTGTQEVKVENVNLCKNAIINATSGAYIDILYVDMDLKPNTTYTLSFIGTTDNKIYLNENITTPQYITCNGSRQSLTFTTKSTLDKTNTTQYKASANGWIIFKNNSSNAETPSFNDVQVEKGSTSTPYTPHQEQTQIVELSGKNILNLSIIGKVPSVTNGNLVDSTTGACSDFIEVDNAKHYMLSFSGLSYMYAFLYGADKSYITAQQYNTSGSYDISTITNFNTCKYVRIRVDNKDYIESPQLEEGSSATPFEEYYNYELCKIGNYQDYLEYDVENDKVYKNKTINKKIFDGSETGWERNTTTLGYRYRINQLDIKPNADNSTIASMYSNYLRATSPDRLYNDDNYSIACFSGTAHTIIIACISNETDTLEKWKTWLSTHNVEVYYVLAEAVKEEITGTLKDQIKEIYNLKSYNGVTNISSNGNLPIVLGVSALKGE